MVVAVLFVCFSFFSFFFLFEKRPASSWPDNSTQLNSTAPASQRSGFESPLRSKLLRPLSLLSGALKRLRRSYTFSITTATVGAATSATTNSIGTLTAIDTNTT